MALITSSSQLNVGTELTINEANRTWRLNVAGNLVAKDGVNYQALYSKLVNLWNTSTYNDSPMPMRAGNVKAGNYIFGQDDSGGFNGWKPEDAATISYLRNGGHLQYDGNGDLNEVYSCWVGLGSINTGAQAYYIQDVGGSPIDFPFDDMPNVPVQIFGDATHGNFDNRTASPKVFVREQGQLFTSSTLSDTGSTLGGDIARFLLNNRVDDNIQDDDTAITTNAPYTGMTYTRYATDQQRDIGGTDYPFRRIIDANGATIEQAYTYAQYLLRQDADIDSGTGTENGKTAEDFGAFNGSDFIGGASVFFDNLASSSLSQLKLTDEAGNTNLVFPRVSGGTLGFTSNLANGGTGQFALFYKDPVTGDDFGAGNPVIVEDADGNPITGVITGTSIAFSFAFDQNVQAGFTGGSNREVVLVGVNPGKAKYQKTEGTIIDSTTIAFNLVAQDDTAHESYVA